MGMNDSINKHQQEISRVCQKSGVSYLAVFGSEARGEARKGSDIDLLVEFKNTPGLIEFIRIKQQLEKILDRKVDLVTKKGLSKYIAPYLTKDIRQIYG